MRFSESGLCDPWSSLHCWNTVGIPGNFTTHELPNAPITPEINWIDLSQQDICILSRVGIVGSGKANCRIRKDGDWWQGANRSDESADADCTVLCFDLNTY